MKNTIKKNSLEYASVAMERAMGKLTAEKKRYISKVLRAAASTLVSSSLSQTDKAHIALLGNFVKQAYKAANGQRDRAIRMASHLGIGEKEFLHTAELLGLELR